MCPTAIPSTSTTKSSISSVEGQMKSIESSSADTTTTVNMNNKKNNTNDNNNHSQSSPWMFAVCSIGICSCYLYYGMLQEEVFHKSTTEERVGATFLLVSQTCSNALVAYGWKRTRQMVSLNGMKETGDNNNANHTDKTTMTRDSANKETSTGTTDGDDGGHLNHLLLLLTAFCYFVAMTSSNESLQFVSYPTAVLAKSCKLIPTMVMGWFVEKRSYQTKEWIGAACITIGIVVFNLSRIQEKGGEKDQQDQDSMYGLGLLALSLFMDGMLGACQGLLKRESQPNTTTKGNHQSDSNNSNSNNNNYRPPSAIETMLFVNVYACIFLLPLAIYTGQWSQGISVLHKNPSGSMAKGMALLNLSAAIGQIFIFVTIHIFSSLVCTTITTTRKFLTILVSVIMFGHVFTPLQWSCVALVFGGLYLGIVSKFVTGGMGVGFTKSTTVGKMSSSKSLKKMA